MGNVTFLDFFSGIGGFRMGFENSGMKCMGHVEWDKYAQKSYKAIYGDRDGYGEEYCGWDIREVRAADLPRVDVWTFGAPCQDFSIAGQRRGMDGDRSSLIREVFRLIEESEHKPEWLVYENVKGMLSSNRGWDFFGILFEMDKLGYDIEWKIFNSKDWGVPQNRERVYTIGHLRSRGGRKVFPITGEGGTAGAEINQIANIDQHKRKRENPQTGRVYGTDGISPCLSTMQGGGLEPKILLREMGEQASQEIKVAWRLPGTNYNQNQCEDGDVIQPFNRQVIKDGVIPTLTTRPEGFKTAILPIQNFRIRKLTPLECWRLQGFPDWAFYRAKESGVSDSQLYKQAGNSVTVNVTEVIGRAIVE